MIRRILPVIGAVALAVSCDGGPAAPAGTPTAPQGSGMDSAAQPATPGTPTAAAKPPAPAPRSVKSKAASGEQDVLVNMHDACDSDTFNAALGDGTCVRTGGMKFNQFIDVLTKLGFVGAWHFAPKQANVHVGQEFVATNSGGEVHTFTEVAQFGGGIVPLLNQLSHTPNVAPECAALEQDDFVPPGATYHENIDKAGAHKYQCCIHPWMRLEAQVSGQ